ncbi:MAG: hypothetical protein M0P69_07425 [Bacteroidales bacterium]|jgi:SAM-dependent methyltransferase|nr:hypothetical protein [Bacteroidales bacterium]
MRNIKLPKDAYPLLVFQRTQYLQFASPEEQEKAKRENPKNYYPHWVQYVADKYRKQIEVAYMRDMDTVYRSIRDYLPERCGRILDIGCGVAGINIHLSEHYNGEPEICLMDKTKTEDRIIYGFTDNPSYYNSLDTAEAVLFKNGVSQHKIKKLEIPTDFPKGVDFVLSTYAWGFHFPVQTYLQDVYASMNKGARLIITVREDTDGLKVLKECFGNMTYILMENKAVTVMCEKKE